MITIANSVQHFPWVTLMGAFFVILQIVKGKAHFGFPGESSIDKQKQPFSYWTTIGGYTLVVLVIAYIEVFRGR